MEILTPVADRLGINKIKSELEDLCLKYLKTDVYYDIVEKLNAKKTEMDDDVKDMLTEVSSLLTEHNIKHEIFGRSKSIYSIYKKHLTKYLLIFALFHASKYQYHKHPVKNTPVYFSMLMMLL